LAAAIQIGRTGNIPLTVEEILEIIGTCRISKAQRSPARRMEADHA
jgi:hypothetical protein